MMNLRETGPKNLRGILRETGEKIKQKVAVRVFRRRHIGGRGQPMVNLLMALCWFAVGCLLLTWHALHPERRILTIGNTGISIGWFALLLAAYNLARWWSIRSSAAPPRGAR